MLSQLCNETAKTTYAASGIWAHDDLDLEFIATHDPRRNHNFDDPCPRESNTMIMMVLFQLILILTSI